MDSSWLISWNGTRLLIDPWLVGSEIDGFAWLNEQWHITEPVSPAQVPQYDAIVVVNPYSDHCHLDTLRQLDTQKPLLGSKPSCKRISKEWPARATSEIPYLHENRFAEFGGLKLAALKPENKWIDPIYHSLLIVNGNDAILYASHGFIPSPSQLEQLRAYNIQLLITTFTWFKLPSIMGGLVNLGYDAAVKLADQLGAKHIINTHDEPKTAKGLVNMLSKALYQDLDKVADKRFVRLPNYRMVEV